MNLDPNDDENLPPSPPWKRTRTIAPVSLVELENTELAATSQTLITDTLLETEHAQHGLSNSQEAYGEPYNPPTNTHDRALRLLSNTWHPPNEDPLLIPPQTIQIASLSSLMIPTWSRSPTYNPARFFGEDNGTDDEEVNGIAVPSTISLSETSRFSTKDFGYFNIPSSLALGIHDNNFSDLLTMLFSWAKDQRLDEISRFLQYMKQKETYAELFTRLMKAEDASGLTLLMIAVRNNEIELSLFLIQAGADVNQHNEKRTYAILLAAQKGLADMAKFLVEHGANEESRNMALIPASHFGHLKVVQTLLESGAWQDYTNRKGTTPLMRAAQEGRADVVEYLLLRGVNVCAANNEGMTALMLASQRGHALIALKLIDAGSDVNQQTRQGSTALILASKRGHSFAVEALLTAGADIFLKDDRGKAAAETAHRRGHVDLFLKISVGNQLRLMRQRLRRQRCYLLVRLSSLYLGKRAHLQESNQMPQSQKYRALLVRTLQLPRPLLRNVALYLPDCFMWNRRLRYLCYEAAYHPNRVVHQGIQMMDEILCNVFSDYEMCVADKTAQSVGQLALLRDRPQYQRLIIEASHASFTQEKMIKLRQMADIQGALASYPVGAAIHFGIEVAQDVVMLLENLLHWEIDRKYSIQTLH